MSDDLIPTGDESRRRTCIVVPCYNEEARLDAAAFEQFIAARNDIDFVFVNDGSSDGTAALLDSLAARHADRIQALHLEQNSGKAEAVRRGLLHVVADARAEYVGYWDADLATPLALIPVFADTLNRRPDIQIVLGSRVLLLGRDIQRKAIRHYLGRVFATVASLVLSLAVYDTQCGAKLLRTATARRGLFDEPFGSRWIFDVEILARFLRAGGDARQIYELPLDRWADVGESKVKPIDFVRAIGEMLRLYRAYRLPARYRSVFDLLAAPFVRYSGAGAIGTLLHYSVLTVCVEALSVRAPVGAVIGAIAGALVNYWLNYHFTFTSSRSHRATLPRFLCVAALGVGLSGIIVDTVSTRLEQHYLLGQLLATLVVLVVGFLLNRVWTFQREAD